MPTAPLYELRRSGVVLCRSSIPDLGYSPDMLKDMARNGIHLYCYGKKVKSRRPDYYSGRRQGVDD